MLYIILYIMIPDCYWQLLRGSLSCALTWDQCKKHKLQCLRLVVDDIIHILQESVHIERLRRLEIRTMLSTLRYWRFCLSCKCKHQSCSVSECWCNWAEFEMEIFNVHCKSAAHVKQLGRIWFQMSLLLLMQFQMHCEKCSLFFVFCLIENMRIVLRKCFLLLFKSKSNAMNKINSVYLNKPEDS